jgi:hypothetical protein
MKDLENKVGLLFPDVSDLTADRIAKLMGQFDHQLTFLQRVLKSHDINIWLACVLTSQRFLICERSLVQD